MTLAAAGFSGGVTQLATENVALLMYGGDCRPHCYTKSNQGRFGELKTRLDGFGNSFGCTNRIEMAGVIGITGPRNNQDVGSHESDAPHNVVDGVMGVYGDNDTCCFHQAAGFQEFHVSGISKVNFLAGTAIARDGGRIIIRHNEWNMVLLEQRTHDLSHTP